MIKHWLKLAPSLSRAEAAAYAATTVAYAATAADGPVICPERENVFRAFSYFKPEDTRVVILGQDPYHSVVSPDPRSSTQFDPIRKASGLAFGYHKDWRGRIDSSLQNVLNEIVRTEGGTGAEIDRSLQHLAQQGVLLLNTGLTVEAGRPLSHSGIGWEAPIEQILTTLCELPGPRVFLLWGAKARDAFPCLIRPSWDDKLVLETSHPCKFSAHRGFNGCGHFEKTNEHLVAMGKESIKWI